MVPTLEFEIEGPGVMGPESLHVKVNLIVPELGHCPARAAALGELLDQDLLAAGIGVVDPDLNRKVPVSEVEVLIVVESVGGPEFLSLEQYTRPRNGERVVEKALFEAGVQSGFEIETAWRLVSAIPVK